MSEVKTGIWEGAAEFLREWTGTPIPANPTAMGIDFLCDRLPEILDDHAREVESWAIKFGAIQESLSTANGIIDRQKEEISHLLEVREGYEVQAKLDDETVAELREERDEARAWIARMRDYLPTACEVIDAEMTPASEDHGPDPT